MIHRYLKLYMFLALFLSDFLMFAQDDPGTDFEDENGDTGGSVEDDAVPINSKLIFLALAGIAFAYYYYTQKKKLSHENNPV